MEKAEIRRYVRERKRAMSEAEIASASAILARKLFEHPAYRAARSIYGYLSYNQEVRTLPILERALADGKRVAVPKVFGDEMRFLWLTDLSQLALGYCGIPEPIFDEPIADDKTALILMPGLAFDAAGHRIGYGGGFYDKFLSAEPHPTIALCYDFQMFEHLAVESHDLPVDFVIKEG